MVRHTFVLENKDAKMVEIEIILKDKRQGDVEFVASVVGCSEDTIHRMLRNPELEGSRNPNTDLGKKIVKAFRLVFQHRELIRRKFHTAA